MLAVDQGRRGDPASPAPCPGINRGAAARSPVMIVCSPRPRVGRTLVARLLVDYFVADRRSAVAFDANPDDPALTGHLPGFTIPATIADTRGQMALFDRLIVDIGMPKVVDLAGDQFAAFFDIMQRIEFVEQARDRAIDTVILYVTDDHPTSVAAYRGILERFPGATVVPVHNEIVADRRAPAAGHPARSAMPVHIGQIPPLLFGVIYRPGFSIAEFLKRPAPVPTMLHRWLRQPFIAFRDLEVCLSLADFAPLFRLRA